MIGIQKIKALARPTISKNRWSKQFKLYLWFLVADVIAVGLDFATAYLARFETDITFFNQINPTKIPWCAMQLAWSASPVSTYDLG
jgi:hypothetical protein